MLCPISPITRASQNMNISVVIPAYNSAATIERALKSILDQDLSPLEIIVVDDCSSDDTAAIIDAFITVQKNKKLFKVIKLECNSGPGKARNIGAALAQGDYLAFLDSDDYWLPWHLSVASDLIRGSNQQCQIINQQPMLFDQPGLPTYKSEIKFESLNLLRFLLVQKYYCTPGLVVSKNLFDKVHGFPETRAHAEDFELFIKIKLNSSLWIRVIEPRSVIYGKHFFASGKGLSSDQFKMYVGTIQALNRTLRSSNYRFALPFLLLFHSLKFLRRILLTKLIVHTSTNNSTL